MDLKCGCIHTQHCRITFGVEGTRGKEEVGELPVAPRAVSSEALGWASSSEHCAESYLCPLGSASFFSLQFSAPVRCATGSFAKHEEPRCQILSVLARMRFCLFSKKPFCTWGFSSFLLWEVASSFPKNIPHLLFKQGALEELWSLKGVGML